LLASIAIFPLAAPHFWKKSGTGHRHGAIAARRGLCRPRAPAGARAQRAGVVCSRAARLFVIAGGITSRATSRDVRASAR
jgi:hypothetical protein